MSERFPTTQHLQCHLFCRVIDNLGDIGVCWRLARQLRCDIGWQVTLIVDDLASFACIAPGISSTLAEQERDGVRVLQWSHSLECLPPGDVVIESFACDLPAEYVAAMAARRPAPVWINFEYLSAEPWVEGCHRAQSPHPRLPLIKHFFFPGFTSRTGGLPVESGLFERMQCFRSEPRYRTALLHAFGADPECPFTVLVFCYPKSPLDELVDTWIGDGGHVQCLLAAGVRSRHANGKHGNVLIRSLPFVAQERFDELLWSVDFAFVRGEDSFVRAQLAATPLIWQVYRQDDGAHLRKLAAFADRYCSAMQPPLAHAWQALSNSWNTGRPIASAWAGVRRLMPQFRTHAQAWQKTLTEIGPTAQSLARFVSERLK